MTIPMLHEGSRRKVPTVRMRCAHSKAHTQSTMLLRQSYHTSYLQTRSSHDRAPVYQLSTTPPMPPILTLLIPLQDTCLGMKNNVEPSDFVLFFSLDKRGWLEYCKYHTLLPDALKTKNSKRYCKSITQIIEKAYWTKKTDRNKGTNTQTAHSLFYRHVQ